MLTPCLRRCKVVSGSCSTCKRTLKEIKEWKDMSNENRMLIMKELQWRGNTHACPSCKEPTFCAMEMGKSASTCWCMSVSIVSSVPLGVEQCLCRKCLLDEEKSIDTTLNLA